MKSSKRSGFAPIMILVVVVLLVGVYFYIKTQNHNETANNLTSTSPVSTIEPSPAPFIPAITYKKTYTEMGITVTIPDGWEKKEATYIADFNTTSHDLSLKKGNYEINIGSGGLGGRADCSQEDFYKERRYVLLKNPALGPTVALRSIPTKDKPEVILCSDAGAKGDLDLGLTSAGFVDTVIPANWDDKALKEMDTIFESINR